MSTPTATDTTLVNRAGVDYRTTLDKMSTLQDTDLLMVNRAGVDYKCTAKDIKSALGGGGSVRKAPITGMFGLAANPTIQLSSGFYGPAPDLATLQSLINDPEYYPVHNVGTPPHVQITGATQSVTYDVSAFAGRWILVSCFYWRDAFVSFGAVTATPLNPINNAAGYTFYDVPANATTMTLMTNAAIAVARISFVGTPGNHFTDRN
jgi:hypothetical protein